MQTQQTDVESFSLLFARRFTDARKKAKLTQDELASRLGISQQAVGKWENGSSLPSRKTIAHLARELGVFWAGIKYPQVGSLSAIGMHRAALLMMTLQQIEQEGAQGLTTTPTEPESPPPSDFHLQRARLALRYICGALDLRAGEYAAQGRRLPPDDEAMRRMGKEALAAIDLAQDSLAQDHEASAPRENYTSQLRTHV